MQKGDDDSDPDFSESDESAAEESEGEDSDDANDERSMKRKAWKAAWRAWRGALISLKPYRINSYSPNKAILRNRENYPCIERVVLHAA